LEDKFYLERYVRDVTARPCNKVGNGWQERQIKVPNSHIFQDQVCQMLLFLYQKSKFWNTF
jgi:hypothetical protein